MFSSRFITDDAVISDTSSHKIGDAIEQIGVTAEAVANGRLHSLGVNDRLPITGFVVTLGDIHLVNSPSYQQRYLRPNVQTSPSGAIVGENRWTSWPTTISIKELERLAIGCSHLGVTAKSLADENDPRPYAMRGDWFRSFYDKLKNEAPLLPVLTGLLDDFKKGFEPAP
jgi:hypothetical protein